MPIPVERLGCHDMFASARLMILVRFHSGCIVSRCSLCPLIVFIWTSSGVPQPISLMHVASHPVAIEPLAFNVNTIP